MSYVYLYLEIMNCYAIYMGFLEQVVSIKNVHVHKISFCLGRHCCLWCNITSDKLIIPQASRRNTNRSLQTLSERHAAFLSAGSGNLKKAKFYDNVIGEYFFNIPLTQVRTIIQID